MKSSLCTPNPNPAATIVEKNGNAKVECEVEFQDDQGNVLANEKIWQEKGEKGALWGHNDRVLTTDNIGRVRCDVFFTEIDKTREKVIFILHSNPQTRSTIDVDIDPSMQKNRLMFNPKNSVVANFLLKHGAANPTWVTDLKQAQVDRDIRDANRRKLIAAAIAVVQDIKKK